MQRQLRYMRPRRALAIRANEGEDVKMTIKTTPRMLATAVVAGLSLLLTGCFITPGKFTSELVLTDAERFTFTYEGEIFFLGLSSLAAMGAAATEEFVPTDCYDEDTFEDRECTEAELAEQRAEWEANAETRAAEAQSEAKQMAAVMGGIDPTDPEASAELVKLLLRQRGWESVVDKGDGVFDVRYSVSGVLGHDFMFPVIEGFPTTNPFVQIIVRDDQVARINAPGFSAQSDNNPMAAMMGLSGGMAGLAAAQAAAASSADATADDDMSGGEAAMPPGFPVMQGTFRIVTNGRILANNTDEGPTASTAGEVLEWQVTSRTTQAPTALISMANR